jgi:type I restriction enzyme S subunit
MLKNWKTYKLGDLIEVNSNSIRKGDLEWLHYIDIKSVGSGYYESPTKLDFKDAPSRARRLLLEGDTVISSVRPNLKSFFYAKNLKENTIASTGFAVLTPKKIDPRFLYYLTTNDNYIDFLVQSCTGSAYPAFGPKVVTDSTVTIPEIKEQRAIASILSALDDKIENNLAMNKTLENMAMAFYKHWLVDFGPFQEGNFNESELGPIPEGWEVKSVYEVADYINGAAFKSKDFDDDGLYVIKIAELKNGISANTKKTNREVKDELILENGSVLFSWSASLDVFLWDKGKALLNQHIFNVLPNGFLPMEILLFMLKNIISHFQSIAAGRATTMGHITQAHLKETLVAVPDGNNLKSISSEFKIYYDLLLNNMLEVQTLTQLRDTLLPKLISGEVRLAAFGEEITAAL